jgi:hypothetical protein
MHVFDLHFYRESVVSALFSLTLTLSLRERENRASPQIVNRRAITAQRPVRPCPLSTLDPQSTATFICPQIMIYMLAGRHDGIETLNEN